MSWYKFKDKVIPAIVRCILLALYLAFALLPLYWIIVTSLKGSKEIYTFPITYFPSKLNFEGYIELFRLNNFGRYFVNSLLITTGSSLVAMTVSVLSGFALSRWKRGRGKNAIELLLYFTQTIPSFILMVPLLLIFSRLKLVDSKVALGAVYVATVVAFSTIMSKSFFDKIPVSLEEAAKIDGCTLLQSIWHVVLPLTLPGMAAIFCFAFINIWNEIFIAVMLLMTSKNFTVPVGLYSFVGKAGIDWTVMSAGIVVSLLPTIVVFGLGQKYIVAGLTEGSVKE